MMGIGLGLGRWLTDRNQGLAGDHESQNAANHEVSKKLWVSAQQIKERFTSEQHREFMKRAIANSREAGVEKRTGGAFGSVIVDSTGKIVGEGSNKVVANHDPTWHGEMEAIRNACGRLKAIKLDGCVLYTSSEPCPMCLATAYWAGLDGIVYGATVGDSKKYGGLDDTFIYEQFANSAKDRLIPQVQVMHDEAVKVWKEYAAQPGNVPY
jgi:tRNA(Arg) A34 adenosine deaminase TadA